MTRKPVVAGQFYPLSAIKLRAMIESMVDKDADKAEVVGAVSPHAGYIYSGTVAARVISRIKVKGTFVILGPNHTGYGSTFSIMTHGNWQTPLGEAAIDSELANKILIQSKYLKEDRLAHQYEHSIEVQIPFLQYFNPDVKIVPIVLSHASGEVYKDIGRGIARAIREYGRNVVILASSDMTHYEPQASAQAKDDQAITAILDLNEDELLRRVSDSNISMCGLAPVTCLIAAARELGATETELVRYQTSGDTTGDYSSVVGYAGIILKKTPPLVKLAKEAVESYVREGSVLKPSKLTPEMKGKAGVFVSIHKFGDLRGCIGTIEPTKSNVAEETIANAISSATRDPRFPPVAPDELGQLEYNVDVLSSPEPISSIRELDPKKYGAIVEAGLRRGLLLPNLEGVDSAKQQVDICRQKAGIAAKEPVKLYRFEVKRYQ